MYFQLNHTCKAEANWRIANNCCSVTWGRLSTHSQPGYIGNGDTHIKNMVTWQEHYSGVRGKIQFSFLCILRECCTVDIVRAGWAWGGSRCDTVHLSRAIGEGDNEQCCHKNKCGLSHHAPEWLQRSKVLYWKNNLSMAYSCKVSCSSFL